jgi:hypothetical protein
LIPPAKAASPDPIAVVLARIVGDPKEIAARLDVEQIEASVARPSDSRVLWRKPGPEAWPFGQAHTLRRF